MNLSISQKLTLCCLVFLLPICILGYFVVNGIQSNIAFAEKEIAGNTYYKPLMYLLHDVSQHKQLSKTDPNSSVLGELEGRIKKHLQELVSVQKQYGSMLSLQDDPLSDSDKKSWGLASDINLWGDLPKALETQWAVIMNKQDARPKDYMYDSIQSIIRAVIVRAGDKSNLILDPDLDSYYLMDATIVAAVDIVQYVREKQTVFTTILSQPVLDKDSYHKLSAVSDYYLQESNAKRFSDGITTALAEDKNFYGVSPTMDKLSPLLDDYQSTKNALLEATKVLSVNTIDDASNAYVASTMRLWEASHQELNTLLVTRIADFREHLYNLIVVASISVIFAAVLFILIARSISGPLKNLEKSMLSLASGNNQTPIPYLDMRNEMGDMAKALNSFKETAIDAERLHAQELEEQKRKDSRSKLVNKLVSDFDAKSTQVISSFASASKQMSGSADSMLALASKSVGKTQSAASAIDNTSHNVKAIAAAAEELSASINEISSQVHRSAEVANAAVHKTGRADTIVSELTESARKIGDIVKTIGNIASQINLLALNATIESARAGEAGRGFAVVASEVKNLATETTKATDEIAGQISGVQKVVQDVVTALTEIRETINQINGISTMIASAVEEQGAATQEIARNIQTASHGVDEVSRVIDEVKRFSAETDGSAKQVNDAAKMFSSQSEHLRKEVESFIGGIKSA
jgi:methyl-accepting chemotaxis protein